MTSDPKPALAYIRVSTAGQRSAGNGLQRQKRIIEAYARRNGYKICHIYEEVASAAPEAPPRPVLHQALKQAVESGMPLIVSEMSRLFRDRKKHEDFQELLRRKSALRVISCHPEERSKSARSEAGYKSEATALNIQTGTRQALSRLKQEGATLGNAASLVEGRLNSQKTRGRRRSDTIQMMLDLMEADPELETCSLAEAAKRLNAQGLSTVRGDRWTKDSVRSYLREARKQIQSRHDLIYTSNPMCGMF